MAEELTMDSLLEEVGLCGPAQARLLGLVLAPVLFAAMYNAQYVFAALDPEYRCLVPECEAQPPQWAAGEWAAWALPPAPASRCERRAPTAPGCSEDSFSTDLQPCDAWLYRNNNSIVSEFELACHPWKRTMVGTVHSLGVFTALLFVGMISDSLGRRFTFIMTASLPVLAGLARSWAPSYGWYLALEFTEATVGAGVYGTGFVLVLEMLGARRRVLGGSLLSATFALGQALLALLSWAVPYWRTRTRLLYAPAIFFLTYFFCLGESLRWLLSKGRKTEAVLLLQNIAAQNGKTLHMEKVERLMAALGAPEGAPPAGGRALLGEVWRSRQLRTRVLVCSFCWVTCTFTYYGLSINSVSLAGDLYVNYALTALVEMPGVMLSVALLDRCGRRRTIMAALLVCGTSLLAFSAIPHKAVGVSMVLPLAAKACASLAFVSLYIFTSELFPTSARHSLLNVCSTLGRLGSIAAPLSPLLAGVREWLPYLVFGCMALTAAVLLLLTPETLHTRLPDTVQEAEQLAPEAAPPAAAPPAAAPPASPAAAPPAAAPPAAAPPAPPAAAPPAAAPPAAAPPAAPASAAHTGGSRPHSVEPGLQDGSDQIR